jgi:3-methyladenine DNA glycosylase/8-oxoguanine DNA glycosylase
MTISSGVGSYDPTVHVADRTLPSPDPFDVGLTFGPLIRGRHDRSSRIVGDTWIHAMHSPAGPVTMSVRADRPDASVHVQAWGPGRSWVMEHAGGIVGLDDPRPDFAAQHALIAELHRRRPGLRIVRIGAVYDLALATTVEQRVTTVEARRSWHALVRRHGAPAPGGHELLLPPDADVVSALPDWEWRRLGIEGRRAATMRAIARDAAGLARAAATGDDVIAARLLGLRGVGPWTGAHVLMFVAADADAVPVGDWHLPRHVGHALAGEPRADDARMLDLLEPFRPHRARAWRLLVAGTHGPPRRAPRARIHDLMRLEAARSRR